MSVVKNLEIFKNFGPEKFYTHTSKKNMCV